MAGQRFAADLRAGEIVARRELAITREMFAGFAQLTGDAHPIHYDAAYVAARSLRAPIAHGLLLVALTALGATPFSGQLADSMIAMLGTEARFHDKVFEGDTVELVTRVAEVVEKAGNRSIVTLDVDVVHADGRLAAAVRHRFMLHTRRPG